MSLNAEGAATIGRGFPATLSLCLRSRCPVCTRGRLFVPYLAVRRLRDFGLPAERCDQCSFEFAREAGYYFGVLTPALTSLSVLSGIVFASVAHLVFRAGIIDMLIAGGVGVLFGLVVFFRTAMALYLALDHAIDPPPLRS